MVFPRVWLMHYALSQQVGQLLLSGDKPLAVAESCTGGGLAYALTAVSGSSAWFDRGFVTYQAEAKIACLGVDKQVIDEHGQVSAATALAMAQGAMAYSDAAITLATTGLAGPGVGLEAKPVGTVFFAIAWLGKPCKHCHRVFTGTRAQVRDKAIDFALSWLIETLRKESSHYEQ